MKYQTILKSVEAQQYAPGTTIDLPGVELIHYEGVGGYNGRLRYLKNPRGELITVRPSDWIVVAEGEPVKVMADQDFVTTYELTSKPRHAKKSASVADNTNLVVPAAN